MKTNEITKEDVKSYAGMGIFQEAKQRKIDGMGYHARRYKLIWQSKKINWKWIILTGIFFQLNSQKLICRQMRYSI